MEDATAGLPHHVQLPLPAHNTDNPQVPTDQNENNYRNSRLKGTVRPDWICLRVVLLEGLEKDINRYMYFYFLFLIFNIWQEFKVLSRFMQKWIQPPACLDQGLHVLKPRSFPPNHAPKMQERHKLFFGLRLVSKKIQHPRNPTIIEQYFGRSFHQIKVCQLIGRQDSICKLWSEQAGGWIHFYMKRLRIFKYSRVKYKK